MSPPAWWRRGRRPIAALLGLLALLALIPLASLKTALVPEALFPPSEEEARAAAELRARFGVAEESLVVLLRVSGVSEEEEGSDPVLSAARLGYLHRVARHLEALPAVEEVRSLATTPLPHRVRDEEEEATLADLEGEDREGDSRLGRESADPVSPEMTLALQNLFPEGSFIESVELRERGGHRGLDPVRVRPLVRSLRPDAGPGAEASEAEVRRAREAVRELPALRRRLISEDGRVALVLASLKVGAPARSGGIRREQASEEARGLREWLAQNPPPPGTEVRVSGLPEVRASLMEALLADRVRLVLLACLGSVLVLALFFRSLSGVLLPLSAAGISTGMVVGGMALFGEPLNLLNNVVPPLLITIGLGDAVHLLARYRELRAEGQEPERAAWSSMRAVGVACFLTSITTAIGFASLAIADNEALRRFGLLASLGVLLAFVVTLAFVPASAPDFSRRAVKPEREEPKAPKESKPSRIGGLSEALARLSMRLRWPTVALFVALSLGALALAPRLTLSTRLRDQIEPGSAAAEAAQVLDEELSGLLRVSILLRSEERDHFFQPEGVREVRALQAALRREPAVRVTDSHVDRLEDTYRLATDDPADEEAIASSRDRILALVVLAGGTSMGRDARANEGSPLNPFSPYVRDRGRLARVEVGLRDLGDEALSGFDRRLRTRLEALPLEARVVGESHGASLRMRQLSVDLLRSLALAVGLIFLVLGILLKSPRLALIALPPNLFPLAVVLAAMALFEIPLNASSAIVFTVSFGLAVDGTIHLLARYREERELGRGREEAVANMARRSGRAVTVATLTLALGFGALLFARFVPIRRFAELSLIAISSSLIAELTFLPALLRIFGRADPE